MENSSVNIFVLNEDGAKAKDQEPKSGTQTPNRMSFKKNKAIAQAIDGGRRMSLDPLQLFKEGELHKRRASSISSLGNWTGAVIVSDISDRIDKPSAKWLA